MNFSIWKRSVDSAGNVGFEYQGIYVASDFADAQIHINDLQLANGVQYQADYEDSNYYTSSLYSV